MNCPRCQEKLKRSTIAEPAHRLVIDSCPSCGGMWFDREQLNELERIVEPALIELRDIPPPEVQREKMECPACNPPVSMMKSVHCRDQKVIVDYCPECSGIWLDHGELDAIQKESWFITLGRIFRFISGIRTQS